MSEAGMFLEEELSDKVIPRGKEVRGMPDEVADYDMESSYIHHAVDRFDEDQCELADEIEDYDMHHGIHETRPVLASVLETEPQLLVTRLVSACPGECKVRDINPSHTSRNNASNPVRRPYAAE
jgi:hypothetical protein